MGTIAFGYRLAADGKNVEPHPSEQAALTAIPDLREQGQTLRGIVATLNWGGGKKGSVAERRSIRRLTYLNGISTSA